MKLEAAAPLLEDAVLVENETETEPLLPLLNELVVFKERFDDLNLALLILGASFFFFLFPCISDIFTWPRFALSPWLSTTRRLDSTILVLLIF